MGVSDTGAPPGTWIDTTWSGPVKVPRGVRTVASRPSGGTDRTISNRPSEVRARRAPSPPAGSDNARPNSANNSSKTSWSNPSKADSRTGPSVANNRRARSTCARWASARSFRRRAVSATSRTRAVRATRPERPEERRFADTGTGSARDHEVPAGMSSPSACPETACRAGDSPVSADHNRCACSVDSAAENQRAAVRRSSAVLEARRRDSVIRSKDSSSEPMAPRATSCSRRTPSWPFSVGANHRRNPDHLARRACDQSERTASVALGGRFAPLRARSNNRSTPRPSTRVRASAMVRARCSRLSTNASR